LDLEKKETQAKMDLEKAKLDLERERMEKESQVKMDLGKAKLDLEREQMEKEFEMEKLRVENSSNTGNSQQGEPKINRYQQQLTNQKDPEEYFIAFENFARREGWSKDTWVRRVGQCIEGKALAAMNAISEEDFDYEQLKSAILDAFQLTPENYRRRFRTIVKDDKENVKSFIMRLARTSVPG
jgi:hypothetical protein